MFGKGINWVSTPLLLSMRPYAHILSNHAQKGSWKHVILPFRKPYAYSRRSYRIYNTKSWSHRYVHQKTNNNKLVKSTCMSFNCIHSHVTQSSSHNCNMHEQEYISSWTKQDNYPWTPIKSTSAMTKRNSITLLNQVTQQELWPISPFTYHNI